MDISIVKIDDITGIKVVSVTPFNEEWNLRAKELAGRWNPKLKAWIFDSKEEERVRELARDIFGTDGSPVETVVVDYDLWADYGGGNEIWLFGRKIVWRPRRDDAVKLGEGVILLSGGFPRSGGSR
jgi:hypothetical protein